MQEMNKIIKQLFGGKNKEYFLLSLILVLGFLVRLYKIDNPIADWHSWRQADTASVTRTFVQRGIDMFSPRYHDVSSIQTGIFNPEGLRLVEFPLFNLFHALLYGAFPSMGFEVWGRLVSVLFSLISVVFIYLIGKRLMGSAGGLLAAFFFAFIPYNIYFSRVVLPESMGVALALAGVWFFVRYFDSEGPVFFVLSGAFIALGLLVKPAVFFYTLPLLYLFTLKHSLKEIVSTPGLLIKALLYVNLAFAPFFLWRIWVNLHPAGIPHFYWAFNGDRIRFRPAFWRWIFGERIGNLILGIWGVVPFTLGIFSSGKKNAFPLVFFASMILYTIVFATANVRHDYYQIFLIPPIALLLAQGVLFVFNSEPLGNLLNKAVVFFCIVMMLGAGTYQIKEFYKINHPELMVAGEAVKRLTPEDAWVIAPYNGDTAFLYQTGRWGWPVIDDSVNAIITRGADYYVSVDLHHPDTKMIRSMFKVIEETDEYMIADLKAPITR